MLAGYGGGGALMLRSPRWWARNTVASRYLNTVFSSRNGIAMGTLANYATGTLGALAVLLALGEPAAVKPLGTITFRTAAMFLGGAVGVVFVQMSIYITSRMPAFVSTLLIFISQLGTGLLLDFLLTGAFNAAKLLGGLLVMLGLWHFSRVSRRAETAAEA